MTTPTPAVRRLDLIAAATPLPLPRQAVVVQAPIRHVFAYFDNLRNVARWMRDARAVGEVTGLGRGATCQVTMQQGGDQCRMPLRCTERTELLGFAFETSRPLLQRWTVLVSPRRSACLLRISVGRRHADRRDHCRTSREFREWTNEAVAYAVDRVRADCERPAALFLGRASEARGPTLQALALAGAVMLPTATAERPAPPLGVVSSETEENKARLIRVHISPSILSLRALGEGAQLKAVGHRADGSTEDLTRVATWISSAPAIAGVRGGFVSPGAEPGFAKIVADCEDIRSTVALARVAPALTPRRRGGARR